MRNYLSLRVSRKEPLDLLYFTPSITLIQNLDDGSRSLSPELSYTGITNLELRLRAFSLSGNRLSNFGEKQNERRLELRAGALLLLSGMRLDCACNPDVSHRLPAGGCFSRKGGTSIDQFGKCSNLHNALALLASWREKGVMGRAWPVVRPTAMAGEPLFIAPPRFCVKP